MMTKGKQLNAITISLCLFDFNLINNSDSAFSVRNPEKMTMKMIPALNPVRIQNQITQGVMIHLTVKYQLVRFLWVIYPSRNIEGDAAGVEVEADQKVHPHHGVDPEVGQGVAQEADQHVHIHAPRHEARDLCKFQTILSN